MSEGPGQVVYLQEASTHSSQGRSLDTVLRAALVAVETNQRGHYVTVFCMIELNVCCVCVCVRAYPAGAHHSLLHILSGAGLTFCFGLCGDVATAH